MSKIAQHVIISPVITEKSTELGQNRKYAFRVDDKASKVDIKNAIQDIFKVKVTSVNTMNVKGKWKRVRAQIGKTASWKKAIVTLKEGDKIEFV